MDGRLSTHTPPSRRVTLAHNLLPPGAHLLAWVKQRRRCMEQLSPNRKVAPGHAPTSYSMDTHTVTMPKTYTQEVVAPLQWPRLGVCACHNWEPQSKPAAHLSRARVQTSPRRRTFPNREHVCDVRGWWAKRHNLHTHSRRGQVCMPVQVHHISQYMLRVAVYPCV